MRRMLRWAMHGVMGLWLWVGIGCFLAWPYSIFFKAVFKETLLAREVNLNRMDGPWYEVTDLFFAINDGWIELQTTPSVVNQTSISPDPQLQGLVKKTYVDHFSWRGTDWNWINPINGQPDTIKFIWSRGWRNLEIAFPLWLPAAIFSLMALTWFYFSLRHYFRHRTRLQTNLCLHCGYNLTGVVSDNCPKCGAGRPLVTVRESA